MSGFDPAALARRVSTELRARADPDKAAPMAAYMKTDMPFYGVQRPGRRAVLASVADLRPTTPEEYEAGVLALWTLPHREEKYLAIDVARHWSEFIQPGALPLYERLIREGAWWDLVDGVAPYLVGRLLLEHREAMTPVLETWIDDPDLWIRRAAIIAQLKHRERTDADMLFRFCLARAHETGFFIRKAIGWALREHSKAAPEAVAAFLAENRNRLSTLSVREGSRVLDRRSSV